MRSVLTLEQSDSGELTMQLSDGATVHTGSVVLATGVSYRRLLAPGVDELVGRGVFYSPAVTEAAAMTNQPVVVVGGGNSAGQAAMYLSKYASTVTLLVRSSSLAASMSEYLIRELQAATNVTIRYRCEVAEAIGDEHLERITVRDTTTGVQELLESAGLFVLIGSQPRHRVAPPICEARRVGIHSDRSRGRSGPGRDDCVEPARSLRRGRCTPRINQTSRLRRRRGRDRHQPDPPIPRESRPHIARSIPRNFARP